MTKPLDQGPRLSRRLDIVYRPIGELTPHPANARQHSTKQVRQLARSIDTFGFNVPVLVDAELNVIAGHGRLLGGRELGIIEVPTICLDHLTPAQARAFMIADNRLTESQPGTTGCWRSSSKTSPCSGSISPSKSSASSLAICCIATSNDCWRPARDTVGCISPSVTNRL